MERDHGDDGRGEGSREGIREGIREGGRGGATRRQKMVVFGFLALLCVQVFTTRFDKVSPATVLGLVVDKGIEGFRGGGRLFMHGCHWVADIFSIRDVAIGVYDLLSEFTRGFWSPYHTFSGMFETFYEDPKTYAIAIGTGIPLAALVLLLAQRNMPEQLQPVFLLTKVHVGFSRVYRCIADVVVDLGAFFVVLKLDHVIEDLILIAKPLIRIVDVPAAAVLKVLQMVLSHPKRVVVIFGLMFFATLWYYGHFLATGSAFTIEKLKANVVYIISGHW